MHKIPLAILAALDDEIRVIRSKMEVDSRVHLRPSLFENGRYGKNPVLLVRSGLGRDAMHNAIIYCLDRYAPKFCLHVGYCGGADPKNQPGDIIVASAVIDANTGRRFESDAKIAALALSLCLKMKLRADLGALVTVDNVIALPHEKAFKGTEHGACAIDMESSSFVAECASRNIPNLVVRAVLDPLDVALPDMGGTIDKEGKTDGLGLAEHIIKNPKDILQLPRMQYFANEARGAITTFVDAWISA